RQSRNPSHPPTNSPTELTNYIGTPPDPPGVSGSDGPAEKDNGGEWRIDTQYQAGDIFTYKGELFRVKKAHESNFILSPENISYAGEIHDYLERI
ncbi:hypothetical protein, partial [Corynebacterium accolens]|uniref:hypothetical protein n=1 Tax=Corynebacterium accolens TaxID=38284 RepID=UPI00254C63A8